MYLAPRSYLTLRDEQVSSGPGQTTLGNRPRATLLPSALCAAPPRRSTSFYRIFLIPATSLPFCFSLPRPLYCEARVSAELLLLLPRPPLCWDYEHVSPCLELNCFVLKPHTHLFLYLFIFHLERCRRHTDTELGTARRQSPC